MVPTEIPPRLRAAARSERPTSRLQAWWGDCDGNSTRTGLSPPGGGPRWHQSRVQKILANPLYAGRVRHKGEVFEGKHELIVAADEWERVQAIRSGTHRRRTSII